MRPDRDLDHECPARLRDRQRRFLESNWVAYDLCADCLVLQGNRVHKNLSARRSPQLVPVTMQGGVGSRCLPARAVMRAITATKHEPGLSPSYSGASYGSAMEAWVRLMGLLLSHFQRERNYTTSYFGSCLMKATRQC